MTGRYPWGTGAAPALACGDQHKARTYLSRLADSGRINKATRGVYKSVASVASVALNEDNATHATVATPSLLGKTDSQP